MSGIMQEFNLLVCSSARINDGNVSVESVRGWLPSAVAREKVRLLEEKRMEIIRCFPFGLTREETEMFDRKYNELKKHIEQEAGK